MAIKSVATLAERHFANENSPRSQFSLRTSFASALTSLLYSQFSLFSSLPLFFATAERIYGKTMKITYSATALRPWIDLGWVSPTRSQVTLVEWKLTQGGSDGGGGTRVVGWRRRREQPISDRAESGKIVNSDVHQFGTKILVENVGDFTKNMTNLDRRCCKKIGLTFGDFGSCH